MNTSTRSDWHYLYFFDRAYTQRKQKNPNYSLRAFARDLNISPSFLSSLTNGKVGLSVGLAKKICRKLNLSRDEKNTFLTLVSTLHHRSKKVRSLSAQSLESIKSDFKPKAVGNDYSVFAHNWMASAILTLVDHCEFQENAAWISQQLAIPLIDAETIWATILRLELVKRNEHGVWKRTEKNLFNKVKGTSSDLQNHYRQLLSRAEKTLTEVSTNDRQFSTCFLSMTDSDYDYANHAISEFISQLAIGITQRGGTSDRIYCFSTQLFPISKLPSDSSLGDM